jgi:hypothetical protein
MKTYLHKSLENVGEFLDFAITKTNSYMSLKTEHFIYSF